MKKLILIAILLGLTGCGGDNSSNNTAASNASLVESPNALISSQTTLINSANPTPVTARALNANFAAAPLGGWALHSPVTIGSAVFYEGSMGSRISSVTIASDIPSVTKVLRGGLAGVALGIAVEQLLGTVDWVLDPENNQIKYKDKRICTTLSDCPYPVVYTSTPQFQTNFDYYSTKEQVCNALTNAFAKSAPSGNYLIIPLSSERTSCRGYEYRKNKLYQLHGYAIKTVKITTPTEPKTLPLETVAQKVISNADSGSLDAQVATNAAVAQILSEAEQYDTKIMSILEELEANAEDNNDKKCPSGIRNADGDCWICSNASHGPIRGRVVYAKSVTQGLGKCERYMNSSELLTRNYAYAELGTARDTENACWDPVHQHHVTEATKAKNVAAECNAFLGILGQ